MNERNLTEQFLILSSQHCVASVKKKYFRTNKNLHPSSCISKGADAGGPEQSLRQDIGKSLCYHQTSVSSI